MTDAPIEFLYLSFPNSFSFNGSKTVVKFRYSTFYACYLLLIYKAANTQKFSRLYSF